MVFTWTALTPKKTSRHMHIMSMHSFVSIPVQETVLGWHCMGASALVPSTMQVNVSYSSLWFQASHSAAFFSSPPYLIDVVAAHNWCFLMTQGYADNIVWRDDLFH
jgi:hypothetical protein